MMKQLAGTILFGALAAGTLALSAPAEANCASISGISVGTGCNTPTVGWNFAVAVGPGATASAAGLFSGAVAEGTNAKAATLGVNSLSLAYGTGAKAATLGNGSAATSNGTNAFALTLGNGSKSFATGINAYAAALGNLMSAHNGINNG